MNFWSLILRLDLQYRFLNTDLKKNNKSIFTSQLKFHIWKSTPELRVIKKYRQRHLSHFSKLTNFKSQDFETFLTLSLQISSICKQNIFRHFFKKNLEKYHEKKFQN